MVTTSAGLDTASAKARPAAVAVTAIVLVNNIATGRARRPVPRLQGLKGGRRVIGPQHLADQYKEVANAPFEQRLANGGLPVAFAESASAHVRMGDVRIRSAGIRFDGRDAIRLGTTQFPEVQADLERPQINVAQYDPFGADGNGFLWQIELDVREFVR